MVWLYILLGILSILVVFGIIFLIRKSRVINNLSYAKAFIKKEVSFVCYICGAIGAGKTTFGCGLTNTLTDILIDKAIHTIKSVTTIFYDVDFRKMDGIILSYFKKDMYYEETIIKRIMIEKEYKDAFNGKEYDSFMKIVPALSLIKDYITAQLAIFRNNYVYYYRSGFFSQITHNKAMAFLPEMMEIKNRIKNKDYSILPYSIIFEDEKLISKRKANNFQQTAKEDGGANLFMRLIRQMGQSSMYYITTSQEFDGADKHERNLATSIIFITSRKSINLFILTTFILRLIKGFLEYIFDIPYDFKGMSLIDRYKPKSRVKHALFKVEQAIRFIYSKSYLKYDCIVYHSPKDVDKNIHYTTYGARRASLVFPIKYCYGSVDTYAFSSVQDYLMKNSNKSNIKKQKKMAEEDFVKKILEKDRETEDKAKKKP